MDDELRLTSDYGNASNTCNVCDDGLTEGWYRVTAGSGRLAETLEPQFAAAPQFGSSAPFPCNGYRGGILSGSGWHSLAEALHAFHTSIHHSVISQQL